MKMIESLFADRNSCAKYKIVIVFLPKVKVIHERIFRTKHRYRPFTAFETRWSASDRPTTADEKTASAYEHEVAVVIPEAADIITRRGMIDDAGEKVAKHRSACSTPSQLADDVWFSVERHTKPIALVEDYLLIRHRGSHFCWVLSAFRNDWRLQYRR